MHSLLVYTVHLWSFRHTCPTDLNSLVEGEKKCKKKGQISLSRHLKAISIRVPQQLVPSCCICYCVATQKKEKKIDRNHRFEAITQLWSFPSRIGGCSTATGEWNKEKEKKNASWVVCTFWHACVCRSSEVKKEKKNPWGFLIIADWNILELYHYLQFHV